MLTSPPLCLGNAKGFVLRAKGFVLQAMTMLRTRQGLGYEEADCWLCNDSPDLHCRSVGQWSCNYFDKVEELKGFGSNNKESLAELVWAFFEYWAWRHDYNNSVISVRTGGFLTKSQKEWTKRVGNERHLVCIEVGCPSSDETSPFYFADKICRGTVCSEHLNSSRTMTKCQKSMLLLTPLPRSLKLLLRF